MNRLLQAAVRSGLFGFLLAFAIAGTTQSAEVEKLGAPTDAMRPNPAARLPKGDGASEHWDLTVRLESGHWLVARFIITGIGPGDRNALVIGHVIKPDGSTIRFKNGRKQDRWTLAADGRALDVGTSHLTLRDPAYRIFIDKDAARIDLRFPGEAVPQPPGDLFPDGYGLQILALAAVVEGSLELPGMAIPLAVSGRAALTHTFMDRDEGDLVARRIDFYNVAEPALYAVDWTRPNGERGQWLAALPQPGEGFATSQFEVHLEGRLTSVQREGYPVPSGIRLSGACAEGQIDLAKRLLESDPLGILPQPLRWFAGLRMKPHRVWADGPFGVTLRDCSNHPPVAIRGTGITALTFLNRLDHH